MSGYTPKRGDKVNVIVPATVAEVTPGGVRLDASELGPGWWVGSADEVVRLELVEAAPVPFVVGGPITEAMGEPPDQSIAAFPGRAPLHFLAGRWGMTFGENLPHRKALADAEEAGKPLILHRLGDGSVTS